MFKHGMTLCQPATRWEDALPSGNGTLGALVYGNIAGELVLINHEALWFRSRKPEMPSVSSGLPELRRILAQGRYREAQEFLSDRLIEGGYAYPGIDPFHPAFDVAVDMDTAAAFTHYRRSLDFATGEVVVAWREQHAAYQRQLFVSRIDNVVVLHIAAAGDGRVNCRLALEPHGMQHATGMGSGRDSTPQQVPIDFTAAAEDGWLTLCGCYHAGGEFGGVARVVLQSGQCQVAEDGLHIRDAGEVLVLLKLYANEPGAPARQRLREELSVLPADYAALLHPHATAHGELFRRQTLDLRGGELRQASNEELLWRAYDDEAPLALIERAFHYGRYLLISSSRPGGLPANLQGVWNGDYMPAWSSDFHNDENIQMNYWQALPGNLAETTLPFFAYYESMLDDYRRNARMIYGCRGILMPVAQSTNGMIFPGLWINWTAGAGWMAQLFYDYWLFTGDRQFLATRAIPFMKEVALFYEDFVTTDDRGCLFFSPSLSPENAPLVAHASLVTVNATMDVAIAREVLTNLCAGCELLGIEADGVARWRALLAALPPYEVNAEGALREWLHPELQDNYQHRHQSHLYPVFPGFEITEESSPTLFAAARVAVEKRLIIGLTSQTGWSFAHMANIYARLGDGDRAQECLELITRSCMGPNLFTYHNDWRAQGLSMYWGHGSRPPFQIDANFGFSAAVLEMLLFSQPGLIKLLPALPAAWHTGTLTGMCCRGGIEVSLQWEMAARRLQVSLRSATAQTVTVKFPITAATVHCTDGKCTISDSLHGQAYKSIMLSANENVTLVVGW